ncbi:unnamed protein product [Heterobilharzia americana]|nr:unnamed protein product [Heterobilharzia americana]
MTLVCVLIFTCLCYRIIDYFNRYEMMKSLFVYNKYYMPEKSIGLHNNRSENFKSTSKSVNKELKKLNWFTITLCNLNPMRGSALFTVQNGSQIYDMVSRGRQNEIDFNVETVRQASRLNRISIELLKQTGHKLTDMLKYCHTGNERCTFQNFTSVLTTYGQCYRMKLERSVHEVSFVLDSQDYDYIIPHRGLVGFRLWIHASEKQAYNMLDLKNDPRQTVDNDRGFQLYLQQQTGIQSNEIIVSTEFQTLIRVALDMNVRLMQNNLRHLCSTRAESVGCENDERDGEPHKDSLGETIWLSSNNYQDLWNARIVSATQSSKASMMYSLLSLRYPNLFVRNKIDLERGLRIQQRAYIQLVNETAFNELRNLVSSYEDLRNQLGSIKQLLHEIEIGFWRDQREALQMTHTDITCSKMVIRYFETLINITRTFQDDLCGLPLLDAFYTTSLFDCHNYTQPTYSSSSINDYRGQVNITSVYQFPSHAHLSSWLQVNYPHRSNRTLLLHDQINNIDKNVYDMINNPALLELQVIQLFFSNATNSSKLKDILRKYLKLLSAKRMQMTTRTSSTRYGLSLGSHLPTSSSSVTSSLTSSPSSPSSTSSDASSITSSSLSSSSASSASTSVLHSFRFPERVNSLTLSNDDPKELLCSSQIQIHIDSIYNVKLEKLGENIATCLQRLESFQTSMNLIIQWNKPIIKTFSIDVEHSQKLNEANLVTFTIQIEKMEMGISMTQLTPMYKIFSPFGEIMGICFGTLSLLIPICLTVDYCFSMKCKSSPDRHEKSIP